MKIKFTTLKISRLHYIMLPIITGLMLLWSSCNKDNKFLYRKSGTWEIQSMRLDYLNAAGGLDSSVSSGITGFFMFYDTPTEGSDRWYLSTHGITVKNVEQHGSHFYQSQGSSITMSTAIANPKPERIYTLSADNGNDMTMEYTGAANGMYTNYTGMVKEHIVLQRIKF